MLKNSGWAATGQAVNAIVTFVETILLARFLSVKMFGMLIVIVSTAELIFGILDFRTGEAVIKYLPELKHSKGNYEINSLLRLVFLIDGIISAFGFIIIIILNSFFIHWIPFPSEYAYLLIILGGGLALKAMVRSVGSYLRVTGSFSLSIKLGIVSIILRFVIICVTVIIAPEISTASWAIAISNAVFFVLMLWAAILSFRHLNINPLSGAIKFDNAERKSIMKFLLSTNLAGTVRMLSTKLDVIVIATLSSTGIVALYKVAVRIAGILLLFSDPLLVAIYPEMSQLYAAKAISKLRKMVKTLTKILAIFAVLYFIIFAIFGKWILGTLINTQYLAVQPIALVMLLGTSFAMIFFWTRPLLLVYEMASKLILVAIIALAIQFGCLYMLLPVLGAQGAGLALALNYFTTVILYLYLLLRKSKFVPFKRRI